MKKLIFLLTFVAVGALAAPFAPAVVVNDSHVYVDLNSDVYRVTAAPAADTTVSADLGWCNPSYQDRVVLFSNRGAGTFTVYADYWDAFDVLDSIEGNPTFDVPADRKFYELKCNCDGGDTCNFDVGGGGVWTWSEGSSAPFFG